VDDAIQEQPDPPQRDVRWFPLLIVAAAFLGWSNSYLCSFIFDDTGMILRNPRIHHLWPPWEAITVPTRFVADLSFAANAAIGGFNPADFHMTNLLIHVVAGLLLYGLMRRLLLLPRLRPLFGEAAAPLALTIALMWLVHPLQTESVTYIVQRIEALMGLFYLLVLYTFVRSADSPHPKRWLTLSWFCCLVGMGTKEVIVTAPLAVFLCDGILVSDSWREAIRRHWRYHLALASTLIFFLLLFWLSTIRAQAAGGLFTKANRWDYLLTQSQSIVRYLRLSFVPTGLCLDYRWPLVHSPAEVWPELLAVAGLLFVTAWGTIRRRLFAFPAACFFVVLAPTSSLIALDAIFEHRMYLPLASVLALFVLAAYRLLHLAPAGDGTKPRLRSLCAGVFAFAVVLLFVVLTRQRNLDYRSEEAMWRDVLHKRPDNYRTYISLSTALVSENRPQEAIEVCHDLLRRLPDFSRLPFDEIERRFNRDRTVPAAEYAMGRNNLGAALLEMDRIEEAKSNFIESVRVMPAGPWGFSNLGKTLFFERRYEEALLQWQEALRLQPNDVQTHTFLGITYVMLKRLPDAVRQYETAIQIAPGSPFQRAQLAWLLATCDDDKIRNGERAVEIAAPLPAMSANESPRALDVLAAAYAEAGRFEDATRTAEQALTLALRLQSLKSGANGASASQDRLNTEGLSLSASTNTVLSVGDIRRRLDLYRQRKPYRGSPDA